MPSAVDGAEPMPGPTEAAAAAWLTLQARAGAGVTASLGGFQDDLARSLADALQSYMPGQTPDPGRVRSVLMRARWFDSRARAFLLQHPGSTAITLGAGFCTRWHRLRPTLPVPRPVAWWTIDEPSVMAWRQRFLPREPGERLLAASLLDADWLAQVGLARGQPVLLIMEGVCSCLPQAPLEALLTTLAARLDADGIVARLLLDFVHPAWAPAATREIHLAAHARSGFADVGRLAALHPTIRVLAQDHPLSRFSTDHRRVDESFRAAWGQPPYTQACLALGVPEADAAA